MEVRSMRIFFLLNLINFVCGLTDDEYQKENELMTTKVNYLQPLDFVNWPNGTVPFYISSDHFDNEQSQIIMTSLSLVAFKTCLKFLPVMVPPTENQHVLTFVNPAGGKKCELLHNGHGRSEPHVVELGYDCLQAPWMDRVVLRALGLPFEHNRGNRDDYIDVQYENIEQKEKNIPLPRHIGSFVKDVTKLDKYVHKACTLWNCEYVSGKRLILAPTGKITPYHDVRIVKEAAKKGVIRALDAGIKRPLLIIPYCVDYPDGQLVSILGAFEALYQPLHIFERGETINFYRIGFHAEEKNTDAFKKVVTNAIALETSRIIARDISGGDPERMTPIKIVEHVKKTFEGCTNIVITSFDDEKYIKEEFPLLAAVSRASIHVDRHKPCVLQIIYTPSDEARVTETLMLVGKGVTYDTGGADIKISGKMAGMSRDKSGAGAVAGFLKACSILKPPHLKVIGVLCLCRNSIGADSYVADELLVSKSGKTVRVTNTDAEGRFAMADALFKLAEIANKYINPHIYTIATLTGHARASYGNYVAAMDNHAAKATNHSNRLQFSGARVAEGIEVSVVRPEDLTVNVGKCKGDDLLQVDMDTKSRHHQLAAGFLIKVAGLEDRNVKYTHLDIAGAAGSPPEEPTAVPILSLCHLHNVVA